MKIPVPQWASAVAVAGTRYEFVYYTTSPLFGELDRAGVETLVKLEGGIDDAVVKLEGAYVTVKFTALTSDRLSSLLAKTYTVYLRVGSRDWTVLRVNQLVGDDAEIEGGILHTLLTPYRWGVDMGDKIEAAIEEKLKIKLPNIGSVPITTLVLLGMVIYTAKELGAFSAIRRLAK